MLFIRCRLFRRGKLGLPSVRQKSRGSSWCCHHSHITLVAGQRLEKKRIFRMGSWSQHSSRRTLWHIGQSKGHFRDINLDIEPVVANNIRNM